MRKLITILSILFFTIHSYAQNKSVSGYIQDEAEIPLAGVSVMIKNSKIGTMTDGDGNFTLNLHKNFCFYARLNKNQDHILSL